MFCQRCRGLLVRETLGDLRVETGCMGLATRCINCGHIEESVMRANRLRPPAAKRASPRLGRGELSSIFSLKDIAPYERRV